MALLGRSGYVQRHFEATPLPHSVVTSDAFSLSESAAVAVMSTATDAFLLLDVAQHFIEPPVLVTHQVLVDWDDDLLATIPANEDVTARIWTVVPLTGERGRDQIRSLSPPMAGSIKFDLNNRSRDYSSENTSSPIYNELRAGHRVYWRQTFSGVLYKVVAGILQDLDQHPEFDNLTVGFPCLGGLSELVNRNITTTQLYTSIYTGQALNVILDLVGWPASKRNIATGRTLMTYWWLNAADAFQSAVELQNTEGPGAYLGEDGDGNIVFQDRHFRQTDPKSTTSQHTFSMSTEPMFSQPFTWQPNKKNVITTLELDIDVRVPDAAPSVVWQYSQNQPVLIMPGDTYTFPASTGGDPYINAIVPSEAAGDFQTLTGSIASVTIDNISGTLTNITFTAGSGGAYIQNIRLRATRVGVARTDHLTPKVDNAAAIAAFGTPSFTYSLRRDIDPAVAQDLIDYIVNSYMQPRPACELTIECFMAEERTIAALNADVSQRISIVEPQTGVASDAFVERLGFASADGPGLETVTIGCEKISAAEALIAQWSNGADANVWNSVQWTY